MDTLAASQNSDMESDFSDFSDNDFDIKASSDDDDDEQEGSKKTTKKKKNRPGQKARRL